MDQLIHMYIQNQISVEEIYDYGDFCDQYLEILLKYIENNLDHPKIVLLLSYIHLVGIQGMFQNNQLARIFCQRAIQLGCYDSDRIMRKINDKEQQSCWFGYETWY